MRPLRFVLWVGGLVALGAVTYVRERDAYAGIAEDATEGERIMVVVGAVVGDDDVGLHVLPVWSGWFAVSA